MRKLLVFLLCLVSLPALAQPGPTPSPFYQNGQQINPLDNTSCMVFPSTVAGGCVAPGTWNVGGLYVGGNPILGNALPNGKIFIGNLSDAATPQTPSGDCTMTYLGVITCTKTNGTAFGYFATGTDASHLTGSLPSAALPAPTAGTLGGVLSSSAGSNQFATGINTSGAVTYGQPSVSNLSGLGTNVATALGVNVGSSGAFTPNNTANTWSALQTFNGGTNSVPGTPSITSNALTLNLAAASFFNVSSSANVNTVTFSNPPPSASRFNLQITGNGTPWSWVWPSSVSWAEGVNPPHIPFIPDKIIVLTFDTVDGGATWIGRVKFRGDAVIPATLSSFKYFINGSTGNDTNTCRSYDTPCKSWLGLQGKVTIQAGDRICLENGSTLRLTSGQTAVLKPTSSGTVNAPITVSGCGTGSPAVVASSTLLQTGTWASVTGNVYSTTTALVAPNPGGAYPCFSWIDATGAVLPLCKGIRNTTATVTITIASPGVVTWTGHGMSNGNAVTFSTTGALPTGLTAGTTYYVVNRTANTFQVAATQSGTPINTSGTQSGTQSGASELASSQYAFSGGSLYVNLPVTRSPASTDQFEIGQGTVYGIQLENVSHWRFADLSVRYNGNYGVVLATSQAVSDILFDDVESAYNSGDNFNCNTGQCDGLDLRGVYSHHAWPDGSGAGDCASIHPNNSGNPVKIVVEYSTMAYCGKDGFDAVANEDVILRYNFFNFANSGNFTQSGGNAIGIDSGTTSNGSIALYGNIVQGDGSAFPWGVGQYQFGTTSAFTSDTYTITGYCNVFYAQSITNPTFRGVALWSGNGTNSFWVNNITYGTQQLALYVQNSPVVATNTDYNIVNTTGTNYTGISQPAHDLTSNPLFTAPTTGDFTLQGGSPALASGTAKTGLTVATPNRGRYGCSL